MTPKEFKCNYLNFLQILTRIVHILIQTGFNTMENVSEVIKIVIADDHAIFRAGIIKVLNLDSQFKIIGEATNGLDAISLINNLSPDVAVLDIKMPGKTGIEIVRELNENNSPTKCLVLTNYDDPEYILDAIGEGANGYVLKTIEPSNLIDSVKGVAEGEIVLECYKMDKVNNKNDSFITTILNQKDSFRINIRSRVFVNYLKKMK